MSGYFAFFGAVVRTYKSLPLETKRAIRTEVDKRADADTHDNPRHLKMSNALGDVVWPYLPEAVKAQARKDLGVAADWNPT